MTKNWNPESSHKTLEQYYGEVLVDEMFRIRERGIVVRIHPENQVELVSGDFEKVKLKKRPFRPF